MSRDQLASTLAELDALTVTREHPHPDRLTAIEEGNLEEERRLCYVGITRARETLYLTRAATRIRRGKEVPRTPSRFLSDIPAELVEVLDLSAPPPGPPTEKEKRFFSDLKARFAQQGQPLDRRGGSP